MRRKSGKIILPKIIIQISFEDIIIFKHWCQIGLISFPLKCSKKSANLDGPRPLMLFSPQLGEILLTRYENTLWDRVNLIK